VLEQKTIEKEMVRRTGPRFLWATLVGPEAVFTLVEGFVVIYPLINFYPAIRDHAELLGGLALGLIAWCSYLIHGLLKLGGGQHAPRVLYKHGMRLPKRALALRLGMWALIGLGGSLYLVSRGAIPAQQIFTVLTICLVHSLAAALIRWAVQMRAIRAYLTRKNLTPPWVELQADTLFDRLIELSYVLGVATAAFLATFIFLFVPISLEQFLRMETFFPWTGVILGGVWYLLVARRPAAPLLRYLREASGGRRPPLEGLHEACRTAHGLPFVLAVIKVSFFVIAGLLLFVEALTLYDFSWSSATLALAAVAIGTIGTGIYEMIWSRAVLRPVVAHLMAQPGAELLKIAAPSLRTKMLLSFGGAAIFTVLLATFWTYLQYGNLRLDFATGQARREMVSLMDEVRKEPARARELLSRAAGVRGSRHLFVPHQGAPTSPLPSTAVATIRRLNEGTLELADQGWAGAFRRIEPRRPALGSLLVLLPAGETEKLSLNLAVLVFFFFLVLAVSLGAVLMTSADLTRPLTQLEQRATEMSRGRLDRRVLPGGEFDELGRLTLAFEQMRRSLKDKIQTIEKLNIGLEEKVRVRTVELERSNTELVEAIDALKEAQARLVTSEKLASVGQLVAGIAHEINNPVNAVVNTVKPLAETVDELVNDPAHADEAREDLQAMLRVITSGARRTQRIVQALRNYSRPDDEGLMSMDLGADIDETLALLQHKLHGVTVERELKAEGQIEAYRGQLNQALMNLLANAAGAVEGRAEARVTIRTRDVDDLVVIEVEDNGPGIDEEVLPQIFDPFFTTKDVGKGTGLGLSITHRIVERHGGSIEAASRVGEGTTFTVKLPRRAPKASHQS
jgi:signal transduction histidine kinase